MSLVVNPWCEYAILQCGALSSAPPPGSSPTTQLVQAIYDAPQRINSASSQPCLLLNGRKLRGATCQPNALRALCPEPGLASGVDRLPTASTTPLPCCQTVWRVACCIALGRPIDYSLSLRSWRGLLVICVVMRSASSSHCCGLRSG